MARCVLQVRVVAKTYRELVAWQLAFEFCGMVHALIASGPVTKRRRYCEQLDDSSESVARNIAEGFGRYNPAEFSRYLSIARGSLDESDSALRSGVAGKYFPAESVAPIILVGARCQSAIYSLQAYLRKAADDPQFAPRHRRRPRKQS